MCYLLFVSDEDFSLSVATLPENTGFEESAS